MRVARLSLSLTVRLVVCLGVFRAALAAEPAADAAPASAGEHPTILAARSDDVELLRRSRIWYVLSQDNSYGPLLGMPQRLGKAILPSRRKEPMWQGVADGASIKLVIEHEAEAEGEIFFGFFGNPQWWMSEPVQVRSFAEPGRRLVCRVDRLPPGKYWIGAMVGGLPAPQALGVHSTWPAPVEVKAGEPTVAELRVSSKFQDMPAPGSIPQGRAGQWPKMDPTRMVTVHTVDTAGMPVPFCSVTLCERDPGNRNRFTWFREVGTDDTGHGYCDELGGPFSILSGRYDFLPEQLALRSQYDRQAQVRELAASKNVTVTFDGFLAGNGRIKGRVYGSDSKPLTGYFLSVDRTEGEMRGDGEYRSQGLKLPIIDTEGRFVVEGLASGDYTVEATDFDVLRHVCLFGKGPRVHLGDEDDAEATVDIELETRELRYGRAVFDNGKPVTHGAWIAAFNPRGGPWRGSSVGIESDGSFRVLLSKSEHEGLIANAAGKVEFRSYGTDGKDGKTAMAEVPFEDLSPDPLRPTEVALRFSEDKPVDGTADADAKRADKWKLTIGARPDFKLVDTSGHTHRLADYRGKVVWINFFGTGCVPCMREWPHLVELSKQQARGGLVVLAICPQSAEAVEEFARQRQPPFAVLVDEKQESVTEFFHDTLGLALPTNILIDRDGRIAHLSEDFTDEKFAELTAKVGELLDRKAADEPTAPD
ncbi:MAG TPA: TlpA disulfide reductase family protein [Pirellulales bacterium]|jgi:peroxiredoxin|nr:TlpA disulfide reductase family protein [Pirellulales bacterium]